MEITQDFITSFLQYDPETGIFTRLLRNGTWRKTGGVHVGTGYRVIGIHHKPYFAHRLAFLYVTGKWPEHTVDHINGVKTDNRWSNLRDVTIGVNLQNKRAAQKGSRIPLLGVSHWPNRRGTKKFVAQLVLSGQRLHCSYHYDKESAQAAYLEAKRLHHVGAAV